MTSDNKTNTATTAVKEKSLKAAISARLAGNWPVQVR